MATLDQIRIVLVEPSHPGNIGGAARAMKTMGLTSLWLVRPERFPDPQADWRAVGAVDVVDAANVCSTLDEAIGPCGLVLGTSARHKRIPWPSLTMREAAPVILAEPPDHPIAILFGRETTGLSRDELQRCHQHIEIPASPAYPSLNLAMAVQVVAYELFQAGLERGVAEEQEWDRRPATAAELEGFLRHLQAVLTAIDFYDPQNPRQAMTRFRRLFSRVRPDETEVRMLRGVLSHVERSLALVQSDDQTGARTHTGPN
jgi:tRNA (cytidine32/uridine32-2'-O)-methyltransferase